MSNRPIVTLLVAAVSLLSGSVGYSQEWPSRPIRILVVAAPGGFPDIAARTVAGPLSKALGQPVVVENRAGGGGNIASGAVAKAAPDGYTLLSTGNGQAAQQIMDPNPGFDYEKDLAPVAMLAEANMILVSSPLFPANNIKELIALARQKPGAISMAVSVLGSPNHVGAELLAAMAGIDLNFIAYKGIGAIIPDLMSGTVDLAIGSLPGVLPQVKGRRLKGLAVTRLARSPFAPELPTVDESGLSGFDINTWVALMATGGTPQPIIERLGAEIRRIAQIPEVKAVLEKQGAETSNLTPAELGAFIRSEVQKLTPVLKKPKLK